ncbi:O-antigen ligase family protein [Cronobacter dublinensis]|uniref:O-antigen ligase family protein n=1 Tax=Cronobacter dublinensis TaxID=413497 RepID=UPI0023DBAB39|nr:O-antigen ligase family protein [Cronobacter dublinensis]ELY2795143.1 O-antigen ligase family protein [Cronobacter dublinensis]ELY3970001.1 O-antigen ligase family protein [Cronobacter dublinensis]ELY4485463.1 O-antigen ligase family protein [Cronobacter dublinensis]ELY5822914.1 O-antigen ligase family protein [Cronobacter dublinensis]MDT3667315.1 O-antigen ligase family protein [Cronobacter dublinensis]
MTTNKFEKIHFSLMQLLFGLCAIAFASVIVSPNFSAKIFGYAGALGFIIFVMNIKSFKKNDAFWLCAVLFIIGICDLVWYRVFKVSDSPAINSYRAYLEAGKICLSGAFCAYAFVNFRHLNIGHNKVHALLAIALQLMMAAYVGYQALFLESGRVTLSLAGGADATGAAYTIAFISFYIILVLQHSTFKWKESLILGHFFLTFLMLVTTETRAAIIAYPLIFFVLLSIKLYKEKHIPWKGILAFFCALIVGLFVMKEDISRRYDDFNRDISAYDRNDSVTSVGARFAMWKTGLEASKHNFLWQSTDQRNKIIADTVKKEPGLGGALLFMRGHLHNEVVETLSLKGPSGLLLYFAFIVAFFCYAFRKLNSIILCAFLASIIMFGISGVMFYSKTTPVAWMLTLVMSLVFLEQNRHQDVVK